MYVCRYAFVYVCMYVRMHVYIYVYIYIFVDVRYGVFRHGPKILESSVCCCGHCIFRLVPKSKLQPLSICVRKDSSVF